MSNRQNDPRLSLEAAIEFLVNKFPGTAGSYFHKIDLDVGKTWARFHVSESGSGLTNPEDRKEACQQQLREWLWSHYRNDAAGLIELALDAGWNHSSEGDDSPE